MPLSEHEQRVLRQIERQFHSGRGLARPLSIPMDPREATRNAKRAAVAFAIGLVALLASFSSSWLVGLLGFLVMLGAAVTLVQSLRRLAQERWGHPAAPAPSGEAPPPGQRSPGRPPGARWWTSWGGTSSRGEEDDAV
ncbi:MAG: DUF3040 domain-containing protein [Acidimicrobiales bacterium]